MDHTQPIILFWEHYPRNPRVLDESCFSNWYEAAFQVSDVQYQSVEQFMMAEKARLFSDDETRERILQSRSADESMSLGRMVKHFDQGIWEAKRFDIVVKGVEAKFSQNIHLQDYLLQTKTALIAQASPWDRIWGIGLDAYSADAKEPSKWKGLNLLGKALMKVRADLDLMQTF